jgi:hypothetical protein
MRHWIQRLLAYLLRLFGGDTQSTPAPQAGTVPPPGAVLPPAAVVPPKPEVGEPPKYYKRDSLMTYQERRFYLYVLLRVIDGSKYRIFAKVRLSDLVGVIDKATVSSTYVSETWCKHIDFVLCDVNTLEPLVAIELDDSSHNQYDNRERYAIKDRVCDDAELPLLRVKVQKDYPTDGICEQIHALIHESRSMPDDSSAQPAEQ